MRSAPPATRRSSRRPIHFTGQRAERKRSCTAFADLAVPAIQQQIDAIADCRAPEDTPDQVDDFLDAAESDRQDQVGSVLSPSRRDPLANTNEPAAAFGLNECGELSLASARPREPAAQPSTGSRSPGSATRSAELAEQARAAEAAGIDCVWAVELFRSSLTQAMWLAAITETRRGRHRDRLGVHPQPDDPRALGARHRRGLRRALPARPRRRGQAAERDLARGRVRPPGAAPARDRRGGAADHRERRRRRPDPLSRASTTTSTSRAGSARTPRSARRSRSTPRRSRRGWRGSPATSPTG